MIKKRSYEDYLFALTDFRRQYGRPISNCLYFSDKLEAKLKCGNISCEIYDGCILLFEHFSCFDKVIFYLYDNFDAKTLSIPSGTICDVAFNDKHPVDVRIEEFLQNAGFEKFAVNDAFVLRTDDLPFPTVDDNVIICDEGHKNYSSDILNLWLTCFDDKTTVIPSIDEIERAVCESRMIIYLDTGFLASCLMIERIKSNTAHIRLLCTDIRYRGKGCAEKVENALYKAGKKLGFDKAATYVSETNAGSLKLHEKLGYVTTGKKFAEYIKKEK